LKKRSKKLLSVLASAFPDGLSPNEQKFFGSFFKKELLPSPRLISGYSRSRGKKPWPLRDLQQAATDAAQQNGAPKTPGRSEQG
jgi:hypothetical protein